jgi:putative methyltransferase (TIGR04325 family)
MLSRLLSNNAELRAAIRNWLPPGVISLVQNGLDYIRPAPWEYVRQGWQTLLKVRGWNVASAVDVHKKKWAASIDSLRGTGPLGISSASHVSVRQMIHHNSMVTSAYVLALASRHKQRLVMLDWGGGIGHDYLLGQAVLPEVELEYYCQDLPLICEAGRELLPVAHFLDKQDEYLARRYDLVFASSSVWYEEDWRSVVDKLVSVAYPYLFITGMIFVEQASSYVAIQRPWAFGCRTEYLCWVLNRHEFVDYVSSQDLELIREFLICKADHIHRAPEQGYYRGFLFHRRASERNEETETMSRSGALENAK